MKTNEIWPKLRILLSIAAGFFLFNLPGQSIPTITTQPTNLTVLPGETVAFNVTVTNTGPLTYQWQFNGTNLPNGIITTVAGDGIGLYGGDGGLATSAGLKGPYSLAFDVMGNLYIADVDDYRIRRVNTNGIISTVAGNGATAFTGDGGPATNATLNAPEGVALDAFGSIYVADTGHQRVRMVNTNGTIMTVAGNGTEGGVGVGGAATNANLILPSNVALDGSGNLYISEPSQILEVGTNGIITKVAGEGSQGDGAQATNASLSNPAAVAFDSLGNLYICDSGDNRIRRVGTNGIITTIAGNGTGAYAGDGGAATSASLYDPADVALDTFGNLYIADSKNNRIRKVDTNGLITTIAGKGTGTYSGDGGLATNAALNAPAGMALDAVGNLYFADYHNERIRKVLLYASYPQLTLLNVNATNAGNYSVVVSNSFGSVTGLVASLTVTTSNTPPQIVAGGINFGFVANQFGFNINGAFGQLIVVDGSTDLRNWIPLFTNSVVSTSFYFFDPEWTNFPSRFYRARLP